MERKLMSRCKGLLDVPSSPSTCQCRNKRKMGQSSLDRADSTDSEKTETEKEEDMAHLEVQYLHRTVRDYLHSPGKWDWIISMSPGPFNPHLSLCKSNLLQLKGLDPVSLQSTKFRIHIRNVIKYGKRSMAKHQKIDEVIMLLDEVERVGTVLTTQTDENTNTFGDRCGALGNDHWSSFFSWQYFAAVVQPLDGNLRRAPISGNTPWRKRAQAGTRERRADAIIIRSIERRYQWTVGS